jgi:hypothetical protein
MDDNEWNAKKDDVFIKLDNVHTVKDLELEFSKLLVKDLDIENTVSYRYFFIPDYSLSESRIIIVASHLVGDGVSWWSIFASMSPD